MAIPDYQSLMLPLMELAGDGKEHSFQEAVEHLAKRFDLSEDDRRVLLQSGVQPVFHNRVGWARVYLGKAGLLESPKRGSFVITERGKKVLAEKPKAINVKYLDQFPEFKAFRMIRKPKEMSEKQSTVTQAETNPAEVLEDAYLELREELVLDLLDAVRKCSPAFFERLVIDVLIAMGYGGSRKEAGEAIGRSGDGGIDGIIKEDKLGLDIIYIQAKRWEAGVGRPEIQKFAGALQGQRAKKGIFITTSSFSKDALDYAKNIESKIILLDGRHLAELMIEHNVGVSPVASYEVKKLDSDYFSED